MPRVDPLPGLEAEVRATEARLREHREKMKPIQDSHQAHYAKHMQMLDALNQHAAAHHKVSTHLGELQQQERALEQKYREAQTALSGARAAKVV